MGNLLQLWVDYKVSVRRYFVTVDCRYSAGIFKQTNQPSFKTIKPTNSSNLTSYPLEKKWIDFKSSLLSLLQLWQYKNTHTRQKNPPAPTSSPPFSMSDLKEWKMFPHHLSSLSASTHRMNRREEWVKRRKEMGWTENLFQIALRLMIGFYCSSFFTLLLLLLMLSRPGSAMKYLHCVYTHKSHSLQLDEEEISTFGSAER